MSRYQTEQRKTLISFFEGKSHQSFSALEIYEKLKSENISKSSIYRNISEMLEDGLLYKVYESHRKEALFQYVPSQVCQEIIHLKCQQCQDVIHFDKHISQMVTNVALESYSFKISNNLVLYGECENCSQSNES